ncbi:hypothetical protein ACFFJY_09325 [Fictibacillus aquaticus]|uniref:Uncharacterized protein n=1 Tax=Fictibacillus aquaticus TaxID=2021314 RepID=A0A235FCF7_9BACL|nr:hypothetical protein [Fictibacillus aquaticus]OYD58475.1 hypothetical protein CGZ90_00815 [Fictibacillus aquaticus]
MRQKVTLMVPMTTPDGKVIKDDYGRPKLSAREVKARVQKTVRVIKGADGTEKEASLEVDLMPDINVVEGTEIQYKDVFDVLTKGAVIAVNESTNLAGTKVFFRTVYIG